jgi:hypothetical protein
MPDRLTPRPFWNDGGPLLIAPEAALPHWGGSDTPSGGRVVEAQFRWSAPDAPATDYDRACDSSAESAIALDVGPAWGVVLGTAAAQSALWLPGQAASEVYAVGIEAVDDMQPERLAALAAAQPPSAWKPLLREAVVGPSGLLMAHAASRLTEVRELSAVTAADSAEAEGAVIGDGLRYPLAAGRYDIAACDVVTPAEEYLTFVRFAPRVAAL